MQQSGFLKSPARGSLCFSGLFFSVLFFLVCFSLTADAGTIKKVKGKSVLIDLEGDDASKGDIFYAVDGRGKKLGAIRVTKVKGDRAIGKIVKGRARRGWETMAKSNGRRSRSNSKRGGSPKGQSIYTGGAFLGMNLASMTVNLGTDNATEVALSGSGLAFSAFSDMAFWDKISLRVILGMDKFEATGESPDNLCEGESECVTSINYLSLTALGRYMLGGDDTLAYWAGAGVSILNPGSATSNAIEVDSIKMTTGIVFAAGLDYWISDLLYVPLQGAYNYLPPSENVKASYISIKAGVGYQF